MNQPRFQINVKPYTGRKPELIRKYHARLEIARKIEEFINMRLEAEPDGPICLNYFDIASALGIAKADVKTLLFANRGGSNGITVGNTNGLSSTQP